MKETILRVKRDDSELQQVKEFFDQRIQQVFTLR